jgi:3-hydroxybutyrate dehydrogenase
MPFDIHEPKIDREEILFLPDSDFNINNVCIVTGAASGIGRATAVAAAANGLMAVGLDVDENGGKLTQAMARSMGGQMIFIRTDLTKDADMEHAVKEAAKLGAIRYLVNVAGIQHIDSVENFPMGTYDVMMSLMVRAPFYLSKLTIPCMRKGPDGKGAIGNMGSIHAHVSTINKPVYNITKFAMRALSQSIAAEGDGWIRSFSVSTAFVKTALTLNQVPAQAEQRGIAPEKVVEDVMLGRSRIKELMNPIEVGNIFMFGFSRFARFLDGGDLLFDGGFVLTYAPK